MLRQKRAGDSVEIEILRNSQLINLVGSFKNRDIKFTIVDPKVNKEEVKRETGLTCFSSIPNNKKYGLMNLFY